MDAFPQSFDALFGRLETSPFRRRFRLGAADRAYVLAKGLGTIRLHAEAFVGERLAPAAPRNDGHQTPMRGHPVFLAQHACACCCRGCLGKWHGISGGAALSPSEQRYVVDVIMAWIERQMAATPAAVPEPSSASHRRARKSPGGETPGLPFLS